MKRLTRSKTFLFLLILGMGMISFSFPSSHVFAAKKRIRTTQISTNPLSYSTAKLSRNTNSVILTFINLSAVKKITYELTYDTHGMNQGVGGSISVSGQPTESRDLYFGTCSKGVCTPHTGITNAEIIVQTFLTNGNRISKRYRIRI
jgi:hypothetical protein